MSALPFFRELATSSSRELELVMRRSVAPPLDSIAGHQWGGYNTPPGSRLLGIRKFIKVFVRTPEGVEGHNFRAKGASLDEPWQPRGRDAYASRTGLYRVRPSGAHGRSPYAHALLIDYGSFAGQPWFVGAIRDYLVQPDPAAPDVLCGKAYFQFGRVRMPAGYFILQRLKQA